MDSLLSQVNIPPAGNYVVAVSGGLDSAALLHMLTAAMPDSKLIVAHFDHGIRPDSYLDRRLVEELAASHGLGFVAEEGRLGADATEEQARIARYDFLNGVRDRSGSDAVITAHHLGDRLETAVLHGLRGADAGGLLLSERPGLSRPLLRVSKADLERYARHHRLRWREDPTNADRRLARNFVRHELVADDELRGAVQAELASLEDINLSLVESVENWLGAHARISTDAIHLPLDELRGLDASAIRHIYTGAARRVDPDVQFSKPALDSLVMLTKAHRRNWQKTISSKLNAYRRYGTISLELQAGKPSDTPTRRYPIQQ